MTDSSPPEYFSLYTARLEDDPLHDDRGTSDRWTEPMLTPTCSVLRLPLTQTSNETADGAAVLRAGRRYSDTLDHSVQFGARYLAVPGARLSHFQVLAYFWKFMAYVDAQRDLYLAELRPHDSSGESDCPSLLCSSSETREKERRRWAERIHEGRRQVEAVGSEVDPLRCPLDATFTRMQGHHSYNDEVRYAEEMGEDVILFNIWFQARDPAVTLFVEHVLVYSYLHLYLLLPERDSAASPRVVERGQLREPLPWPRHRVDAAVRFDRRSSMGQHKGAVPLMIYSRDQFIWMMELLECAAYLQCYSLRGALAQYITCWMLQSREDAITATLTKWYYQLVATRWWRESVSQIEAYASQLVPQAEDIESATPPSQTMYEEPTLRTESTFANRSQVYVNEVLVLPTTATTTSVHATVANNKVNEDTVKETGPRGSHTDSEEELDTAGLDEWEVDLLQEEHRAAKQHAKKAGELVSSPELQMATAAGLSSQPSDPTLTTTSEAVLASLQMMEQSGPVVLEDTWQLQWSEMNEEAYVNWELEYVGSCHERAVQREMADRFLRSKAERTRQNNIYTHVSAAREGSTAADSTRCHQNSTSASPTADPQTALEELAREEGVELVALEYVQYTQSILQGFTLAERRDLMEHFYTRTGGERSAQRAR